LHLGSIQQDWLGNPNLALYAIMFMGFPWIDGFGMLIYTAGLQAIPQEVLESTQIDGAGAWTRFLRIERPLIVGQFRPMSVLAVLVFLASLLAFPFYFMIQTSLKDNSQFALDFWAPTAPFHFENYGTAFPVVWHYMLNSIVVTCVSTIGVVIVGTLAGFAFA